MNLADIITDTRLQTINLVHRTMLTVTGGRIGNTLGTMPVFKVTTTGRSSGQSRTVMLTAAVRHDNIYVFVASKGGDSRNPDWYLNMVANPDFTVEPADGGGPVALVARTASAEEKAELWPQIIAAYKGYAGYQQKTDRDIPVVIAERSPD